MTEANENELLETLRTILKIQALAAVRDLPTKKERILFLAEAGLSPKEIGLIVGSSGQSVSQTIYENKKKAKAS